MPLYHVNLFYTRLQLHVEVLYVGTNQKKKNDMINYNLFHLMLCDTTNFSTYFFGHFYTIWRAERDGCTMMRLPEIICSIVSGEVVFDIDKYSVVVFKIYFSCKRSLVIPTCGNTQESATL